MRVLFVAESAPTTRAESGNGSTMISAQLLQHLAEDVEVDLVYFEDAAGSPDPPVLDRVSSVRRLPLRSRRAALLALPFTSVPRATWQRKVPGESMRSWCEEVDVVYLHGLHVFPFGALATRPVVAHEVDPWSVYWAERAAKRSGAARAYDRLQSRRAARLERLVATTGATVLVVSPADAELLRHSTGGRVVALPNGVSLGDSSGSLLRPSASPASPVLTFVGSLDYPPNIEALQRLSSQVWPRIRAAVPVARLVVAGRRPTPEVLAMARDGVEVVPDVPDVAAVFRAARASLYVGTTGRGTKNSVSESILAGCPVIASPESARGQQPGPHLLVGADDDALVAHAVRLLTDDASATAARAACARTGSATADWSTVARVWEGLLREASVGPART